MNQTAVETPENALGDDEGLDRPTTADDWFGAAKVWPEDLRKEWRRGPMLFHVFRASSRRALFAITATEDRSVLPACPGGGRWELFKRIPETGQTRIGFSEAAAKADIGRQGYHLAGAHDALTGVLPPSQEQETVESPRIASS